jgi:hypothetical protein
MTYSPLPLIYGLAPAVTLGDDSQLVAPHAPPQQSILDLRRLPNGLYHFL